MNEDTLLFELDTGGLELNPEPGQFVQLTPSDSLTLPRPFSIAGAEGGTVEVLFEVRGRGTRELAGRREGETLRALGPLGTGFDVPDDVGRATLVAGGIGVAGLRFLARRLSDSGVPLEVIVGARSADRLLHEVMPAESHSGNVAVSVATDDGSAGARGTACDVLSERIDALGEKDIVYACGPRAMLRVHYVWKNIRY